MISDYFAEIDLLFSNFKHIIEAYILDKQFFSEEKGLIDGELYFIDESRLSYMEVVDIQRTGKLKYSYHYMDKNNSLIFRYDNAKHYSSLDTFPHHKHTDTDVISCQEPSMKDILSEIEQYISSKF